MEPSEEVRRGRRALEGLTGFEILNDFHWWEEEKSWSLHCRLRPAIEETEFVPNVSDWFILIDHRYPLGTIKVRPGKDNGLSTTFPHQSFNGEGPKDRPWRSGKLCLDTPVRVLGRTGNDTEPDDANNRLAWHIQRALRWLELASQDLLLTAGDYFELPEYPSESKVWLAFQESPASLEAWKATHARYGYAPLRLLAGKQETLIVQSFTTKSGSIMQESSWGRLIQELPMYPAACWIRLDQILVTRPWQPPSEWGELIFQLHAQDIDLLAILEVLLPRLRAQQEKGEKRKPQFLLIGFPIPELVGKEQRRIHWVPIQLPVLASGRGYAKGFRAGEKGYWMVDRKKFMGDSQISWGRSECWDAEEISERGKLAREVRDRRILLLGAGALGSAVQELLTRAGVRFLTILDPDTLQAGNLVRHTLTLDDLHQPKASRVAGRLNHAAPHSEARGIQCSFPDVPEEFMDLVQSAEAVVDCTADNEILFHLEQYPWETPKVFFSFALGLRARRLYGFCAQGERFPRSEYVAAVKPWLDQDKEEHSVDWAREGIGCWHPIFPARCDDVWIWASAAVKLLEQWLVSLPTSPILTVYEMEVDPTGFIGLRKQS